MGFAGGPVAVAACALLGTLTVRELMALKVHVEGLRGQPGATYVDVAHAAFGDAGALAVYVLCLTCSLGVTSAYLVFIATTLHSLVPSLAQRALVCATAAVVLPVTWLRDFSLLSRMAQSGTAAVVLGYVVTVGYAAAAGRSTAAKAVAQPVPLFTGWASTATGFGSVAFLFCIHFMLFPVATASRASARTGGFECLALLAFLVSFAVNAAFGVAGLIGFGGGVSSIVVNDIAGGTWCLVATKILLCVDLFCSYPLVLASGRQIVERSLLRDDGSDSGEEGGEKCGAERGAAAAGAGAGPIGLLLALLPTADARRRAVRTALVLVTVAVAQLKDFGTIISLVGSFAQVSLSFVLPPLMALRLLGGAMAPWRRCLNLAILPAGTAVAAIATGATLASAFGAHLA